MRFIKDLKDVVENREDFFCQRKAPYKRYEAPSPYDLGEKYGRPVHVADNDSDIEVYYSSNEKAAILVKNLKKKPEVFSEPYTPDRWLKKIPNVWP